MNPEIVDTMVRAAMQVMDNAYVPYGKAAIGACVLASDGTFYTGCNIENAVPRLSVFAEEVAMYRAVADGKREFDAIAVIADTEEPFVPNGAVCQLLAEFNVPEFIIDYKFEAMSVRKYKVPSVELPPYDKVFGGW